MDIEIERFIKEIRNYELLWNTAHPLYKDRCERMLAWKNISDNYGMPVQHCRKKWRNLRNSYQRDVKNVWRYRKHLNFMKTYIKRKATTGDAETSSSHSTNGYEDTIDFVQEPLIKCNPLSPVASACDSIEFEKPHIEAGFLKDAPYVTPDTANAQNSTGRKRHNLEDVMISTLETMRELLKRPGCGATAITTAPATHDKDEDELFCMSLVRTIKKYPKDLKNKAKIGMLRYLNAFEAAHIDEPNNA